MAESTKGGTQVRMSRETHDRFRALARKLGLSQIRLLRTLSFATPDDYMKCEARRLADQSARRAPDERES